MAYRVGVDIGGSFTDFAVLDAADNTIRTLKVLSRPDQPGAEVIQGLGILGERDGIAPAEVEYFTHGTTVGVNTVIQRSGARLALFTTRNFEDVLELARLKMPNFHNLYARRPAPLVSRDRVFPVDERIDASGAVLQAIDEASLRQALRGAREARCEGIVLAFLHAYRNPANEAAARALLQEWAPEMPVCAASEIWPIIREYERTVTACISGYVQPKVAHYLTAFEQALSGLGVPAAPHITKSNGGVMGVEQAKSECVQMILSGTASGVIGAGFLAQATGLGKILSLDIGGTSADVAVIVDGQAEYGSGELIGEFQIHIPSISVTSIGQGGGSIAWVDELGILKVGPESAGSRPGPACFGKGGTRPAVTDAFAVCGWIGHTDLGYNAVQVDAERARQAIAPLAGHFGTTVEETAEDIIRIAVSGMFADTSGLVSRFGIDPREFHFLAFGGAGPMMACYLAREINVKGVAVPPTPGVLSALGGLIADLKNDFIRTIYRPLSDETLPLLRQALQELQAWARAWLYDDQGFRGESRLSCSADMRYRGQSYEIDTPIEPEWLLEGQAERLAQAFHEQHRRLFGHSDSDTEVQIINLRLVIAGATPKPRLLPLAAARAPAEPRGRTRVHVDGTWREVPVYHREDLRAGHAFEGPAIIAQADCTTCVLPDMGVQVDAYGNLVISVHPA